MLSFSSTPCNKFTDPNGIPAAKVIQIIRQVTSCYEDRKVLDSNAHFKNLRLLSLNTCVGHKISNKTKNQKTVLIDLLW